MWNCGFLDSFLAPVDEKGSTAVVGAKPEKVLPGRLTARPLKFYYPKKKVVFQLSFCRGELLNFRVVYWFYMTNKLFVSLQCKAEISLDTGTQLIREKWIGL